MSAESLRKKRASLLLLRSAQEVLWDPTGPHPHFVGPKEQIAKLADDLSNSYDHVYLACITCGVEMAFRVQVGAHGTPTAAICGDCNAALDTGGGPGVKGENKPQVLETKP